MLEATVEATVEATEAPVEEEATGAGEDDMGGKRRTAGVAGGREEGEE